MAANAPNDLYKPFLFIFGRCGMFIKISVKFLEQMERLDTLGTGVTPVLIVEAGTGIDLRKPF